MECTNDGWYCNCSEHKAFWNVWALKESEKIMDMIKADVQGEEN